MLLGLLLISPPTFEIALVGDVMLGRFVEKRILREGDSRALAGVRAVLSRASVVMGNLESPLTKSSFTKTKPILLKADPARVKAIAGIFTSVNVANNHALDCGLLGLDDTTKTLQGAGVGVFGRDYVPWITTIHGVKIGVLGFSEFGDPGIGLATQAAQAIRELRPKVDLLIVQIHWGLEEKTEPTPQQESWANEWVKAGADIIAGHHPHVWQPVRKIGNSLVFFSLGDFLFDSPFGPRRSTGIAFVKIIGGKVASHRVVPVRVENGFPQVSK